MRPRRDGTPVTTSVCGLSLVFWLLLLVLLVVGVVWIFGDIRRG